MTSIEIIYSIITILSLIGGILAWIAKIKWSKEYKEAKEAQIEVLKQHVQYYKDFTSEKVKEAYMATKVLLENRIKELEEDLNNEYLIRDELVEEKINEWKKEQETKMKEDVDKLKEALEDFNKIDMDLDKKYPWSLSSLVKKD